MAVDLDVEVNEQSTLIVTVSFHDEDGLAVVPNIGLCWSLTDQLANVINNRDQVTLTPAETVTIVLHGDDLICLPGSQKMVLTIEGTYDSALEDDLEIKEQATFTVVNLVAVAG